MQDLTNDPISYDYRPLSQSQVESTSLTTLNHRFSTNRHCQNPTKIAKNQESLFFIFKQKLPRTRLPNAIVKEKRINIMDNNNQQSFHLNKITPVNDYHNYSLQHCLFFKSSLFIGIVFILSFFSLFLLFSFYCSKNKLTSVQLSTPIPKQELKRQNNKLF